MALCGYEAMKSSASRAVRAAGSPLLRDMPWVRLQLQMGVASMRAPASWSTRATRCSSGEWIYVSGLPDAKISPSIFAARLGWPVDIESGGVIHHKDAIG